VISRYLRVWASLFWEVERADVVPANNGIPSQGWIILASDTTARRWGGLQARMRYLVVGISTIRRHSICMVTFGITLFVIQIPMGTITTCA
jgi:hypothetical protein